MSGERGSVSVVTAAIAGLSLVLALGASDVARVFVAAARAQTAADAAALAAAQELALPTGLDPAAVAGDYATRNGASLVSCTCAPASAEAVVEVRITIDSLALIPGTRAVSGRARAVVDLPTP